MKARLLVAVALIGTAGLSAACGVCAAGSAQAHRSLAARYEYPGARGPPGIVEFALDKRLPGTRTQAKKSSMSSKADLE
jgi:hypothetical protein